MKSEKKYYGTPPSIYTIPLGDDYEKIPIVELVEKLQAKGYRITRRMFWYYIENLVFPKPITAKAAKGVQGFYPMDAIETMERTLQWRDAGHRLIDLFRLNWDFTENHIKEILRRYDIERFFLREDSYWSDPVVLNAPVHGNTTEWSFKHRAHYEQENQAGKFIYRLTEDTMWMSNSTREKVVLREAINTLENERLLGYWQAIGDLQVLKFGFQSLRESQDMIQLENLLQEQVIRTKEIILQLKARFPERE